MTDAAVESALRALRHRDRSSGELDRRLAKQGFSEAARKHALDTLVRTAVVDDARFALARAQSLAARGFGNERIRYELALADVERTTVDEAISELDPEAERAARIVARRGAGPKTARYLRARGFGSEMAAAVAAPEADELP